ncbi:MAG: hypothetical protein ACJ8AI_06955 [Rhodopila sp.]
MTSTFSVSADAALTAYLQLRAWMLDDNGVASLYRSAEARNLALDVETLFERVREQVQRWELTAIVSQVVAPLAFGYLGYAAALALGAVGATPVLIGLLIGAIIWLMQAPGTWQMLKECISQTVEAIFAGI